MVGRPGRRRPPQVSRRSRGRSQLLKMSCPAVAGVKRYSCENRRLTTQLRLRSHQQAQGKPSQLAGVDQAARPKERNVAVERACTELQVSSTGHSPCKRKTRRYYQKESAALSRIGQRHAQRQGRRPGRRRHIWCSSKVAQVWASGRDRIMRPCLSLEAIAKHIAARPRMCHGSSSVQGGCNARKL